MKIALIARDARKELMVQFCTAYSSILRMHTLCSTGRTGKLLREVTDLKVRVLLAGDHGGCEQIAARIAYNEVDLMLFFGNFLNNKVDMQAVDLMRLCDIHHVPLATNIATAEMLVHGLARGDLDWRKSDLQNIRI